MSAEEDSGSDVDAGVSDDEYNLRDESDGEANEPVSEDDAERAEPSGRDDGGGSSAEDAPDSPPKRKYAVRIDALLAKVTRRSTRPPFQAVLYC